MIDVIIQVLGIFLFILPLQTASQKVAVNSDKNLKVSERILVWTLIILWSDFIPIVWFRIVDKARLILGVSFESFTSTSESESGLDLKKVFN